MVINLNNSHINSFAKGMNSDSAFDQLDNQQYIYGKNIRITKNQLIGERTDDYSSLHEGIVTPVHEGIDVTIPNASIFSGHKILAVDTVDNLGTIVSRGTDDNLYVFRFKLYEEYEDDTLDFDKCTEFVSLFKSGEILPAEVKSVSTVLYKEMENVIKLYIATGVWPLISLRVDDSVSGSSSSADPGNGIGLDNVVNNRVFPKKPITIENTTNGNLKTLQVLYTYRFYNKYGNTTQLAPLTNKILVISTVRNKEEGNKENTPTNIGFKLSIPTEEGKGFTRLQIYRLSYITPGQNALIALIYDGSITSSYDDVGGSYADDGTDSSALQTITIDEFASMSGITIIPKVIELNQEYMFAANVIDDTIIQSVSVNTDFNNNGTGNSGSSEQGSTDTTESFSGSASNPDMKLVIANVTLSDGNEIPRNDLQNTPRFSSMDSAITFYDTEHKTSNTIDTVSNYLRNRYINSSNLGKDTYNDIITSSLLRSLRRGESYRYGIVFYDDKGRHTDVLNLGNIKVPEATEAGFSVFTGQGKDCVARPIGVSIKLPTITIDEKDDVNLIGCQIVRRSCASRYQKTIMQVALARPVSQYLYNTAIKNPEDTPVPSLSRQASPYYPSGFLISDNVRIGPGYYTAYSAMAEDYKGDKGDYTKYTNSEPSGTDYFTAISRLTDGGNSIFQAMSAEIDLFHETMYSAASRCEKLHPLYALYSETFSDDILDGYIYPRTTTGLVHGKNNEQPYEEIVLPVDISKTLKTNLLQIKAYSNTDGKKYLSFFRSQIDQTAATKPSETWVFDYYNRINNSAKNNLNIKKISDAEVISQDDAFTNIQVQGDEIVAGTINYKRTTSIDDTTFASWCAFAKYDLRIANGLGPGLNIDDDRTSEFVVRKYDPPYRFLSLMNSGYIGPGPKCFLLSVNEGSNQLVTDNCVGSYICNICKDNVDSFNELDDYYGFGNYFELEKSGNSYRVKNCAQDGTMIVFDGDIYITPNEITTMYKIYDKNSVDTLQSNQVVNYVPLETKINTFFDYGMNYLNTKSANMRYTEGKNGDYVQERPQHLYNLIYSDNDSSNDIYNITSEKSKLSGAGGLSSGSGTTPGSSGSSSQNVANGDEDPNIFKQRTYYSEPKTNGEFIDSFTIYKAASFIDVDSKYGQITNLLTDKNMLYYWQDTAFGKFSVNERSLINDQNNNTIMLGLAGILSRYDYISTKYGMRLYDFCACSAEQGVYWVDVKNRAVVAGNESSAINYSERLSVLNILNGKISQELPKVHYDLQNNELLCKCFDDESLIIFNLKFNIATSVYTRVYEDIAYIRNHVYGLYRKHGLLTFNKFNYLTYDDIKEFGANYLTPLKLDFIVNPSASITKVYDSQTLIPIKRRNFTEYTTKQMLYNTAFTFETDIIPETSLNKYNSPDKVLSGFEPYTDREGNIVYNIPRFTNSLGYGNRMRGKWMRVNITRDIPDEYFTISHAITKFRQSYS